MEKFFERAIANVSKHGDTDIFPFPIENHVIFDREQDTIEILKKIHNGFSDWLSEYPPFQDLTISSVGYEGFRWATQLDPIWNLYLLSLVLSISDKIESARIPVEHKSVFSYRYAWGEENSSIFNRDIRWQHFMEQSIKRASESSYVVICDISEFYPRISHHRLENAILHLSPEGDVHKKILKILSVLSNTNSYGLPVGGPASRILSELLLNQIDQLLKLQGISFCRYADDFHIFCESIEQAYERILFLTEKLQINQGLQLQKAKTRILSSSEFAANSPLREHIRGSSDGSSHQERARTLLGFSLRFDPYSPNATEEYENLKLEVGKFDIMSLLQNELGKSRVQTSLAKKIVSSIKFIDDQQKDSAAISLIDNVLLLYPLFSNIMIVLKQIHEDLSDSTQILIQNKVISIINSGSYLIKVPINLAFAVRLLSCRQSYAAEEILSRIYNTTQIGSYIRRDVILIMARWKVWAWLSDQRASFRTMSQPERRAFIIASYVLNDEGKHWRAHVKKEFTELEQLTATWAESKTSQTGWMVPL